MNAHWRGVTVWLLLRSIRSSGLVPKGGYDVPHGTQHARMARPTAVHCSVHGRCSAAGARRRPERGGGGSRARPDGIGVGGLGATGPRRAHQGQERAQERKREELVRLRTENRILAEARDILTTPRRSSPSRAGEVSVHCGGKRPPHGHDPMPVSRGQREWVLRVASPPGVHARP